MILSDDDQSLLLSALPGMAYRCSIEPPWELEYVSPGAKAIVSIAPADFVSGNINWASLVHPDDLAAVTLEVEKGVSEERQFSITYRIRDPVLGEKWVHERGQAAHGPCGQPIALVGFIWDMTEQLRAGQALRDSEAHYRAAVELNPQIPWTADPGGRVLEVGPQWAKILGARLADIIDYRWEDALHPDDRDHALSSWKASVAEGRSFDIRYRIGTHDGTYRWMRARAAPKRDEHGRILKWYGNLEDISEQVLLEQQLREAEERYALAARATGDIIWDWNLDEGTIFRVGTENSWLGYPSEFLSNAGPEWWWTIVHPDDEERLRQGILELFSSGRDRWSDEYRVRREDGSYAFVVDHGYVVPAQHGSPRRVVGALQDLSERKQAQETVSQLEAQLLRMSQRTAMAAVAATVAHELNQPLSATANWIAVGQHHLDELTGKAATTARTALTKAESQVIRAAEIIRRMRSVISEGIVRREPASLRRLVKNVQELVQASGSYPRLKLAADIPETADLIEVDPIQIEELLLNLIYNACHATPDGRRPQVAISAMENPDAVTVRVRDNGRGIPSGAETTLFSRFGESTTGGLGVGLSIARTMIQAHGGKIWATNNDSVGASIWFTIPKVHKGKP